MSAADVIYLISDALSLIAIGLCVYVHVLNRGTRRILKDTARRLAEPPPWNMDGARIIASAIDPNNRFNKAAAQADAARRERGDR